MAREQNAEPFGPASTYGGRPESSTWDEDKVYGCVCDSSWPVGFGAGETQAPEYTAADCSQRRCPSGDDPRTVTVDETDCAYFAGNGAAWMGVVGTDGKNYAPGAALPPGVGEAVAASGTPGVDQGAVGNKCFVECANRGTCNRATGVCSCFPGCAFPRRAPCPPPPFNLRPRALTFPHHAHTRARAHTPPCRRGEQLRRAAGLHGQRHEGGEIKTTSPRFVGRLHFLVRPRALQAVRLVEAPVH